MRILVVDDDPVSRRIVQAALSSFGHQSDTADSGVTAWEAFSKRPYDVVVSDREMPGFSGVELCRRIREHPSGRRAYVIIITARGQRQEVLEGMSAGADDYLAKPLDIEELQLRIIVATRISELHNQLESMTQKLQTVVRTDPLTKVGNRLAMQEELALLHARTQRYGTAYSVGLVDVDNFKAFNDGYGHLAGDQALAAVAGVIAASLRKGDAVFRFGGEEFLCVLPAQRVPGATIAMQRLRNAVRRLAIPHAGTPSGIVTISGGIACYEKGEATTPDQLLSAADESLYLAKKSGRNRIESAQRD